MSDELTGDILQSQDERAVRAGSSLFADTRAEGNLDIPAFIALLQDLLKIDAPSVILVPKYPKYLKVGTKENDAIFSADNPTSKFSPTITYRILRREPASIGGNKEPFGTGQKDRTPRRHERSGNPDGTQTVVYGQMFDNLIRFEI